MDERSTTLVQRDGTLDGRDDTLNAMESTVRVRDASGGQQTRWPGKQDSWGGGHPVQVYSVFFISLRRLHFKGSHAGKCDPGEQRGG